MRIIDIYYPKKLSFGENVYMQLVDDLKIGNCKRLFVVTGTFLVDTLNPLLSLLNQQGIEVELFTALTGEPTFSDFHRIKSCAAAFGADCIAGFGGGSVMDVAKIVAALLNSSQTIDEVVGIGLLKERQVKIVCVPTTSGTGSEMSPNAILLDERDNAKKGIISRYLVPDLVYIDPLLTVGVPADITAYTGLDALTHCIEAYCNKFAHPVTDMYALKGIELIGSSLLKAVRNGNDIEARTNLALGSMYGGMCLGPVNTAAVHALAYPLGSEYKVPHGLSNALLLTHVMAFNLGADEKRHSEVAEALGIVHSSSFGETAWAGIDFLNELIHECGLPKGISSLGILKSELPHLADGALKVQRLLKNNLREVTLADAIDIYGSAY